LHCCGMMDENWRELQLLRKFDFSIDRPDQPTKLENAVRRPFNFTHILFVPTNKIAGNLAHGRFLAPMRTPRDLNISPSIHRFLSRTYQIPPRPQDLEPLSPQSRN
jgi:hypothetical protein